ncbi:MAG: dephospho-CoA kinase [Atribacterota bacterium]
MVKVIGIGGGAGSGKSTVASFLEEKGVKVLELDALSRKLAQKGGPIWKGIVRTWGRFFLDPRGNIDRKKLGKVIFRNFTALLLLNRLTHPLLFQETRKWLNRNREENLVAIDGTILFEGGFLPILDWVIFVEGDLDLRWRRLVAKGWKEKEAQNLLSAQRFSSCLRRRAHFVLWNQDSREKLRQEVENFWCSLPLKGK